MQKISAGEWREVFALLDSVHEVPETGRAAWLDGLDQYPATVVGMLRDLLARQTADGFLEQLPQFTGSPDAPPGAADDSLRVGSEVGPYRLTGKLGRGGMSSVWIAERLDGSPRRRIALKLPHLGGALRDMARRMERERDLLGSLEHPGIARLYDAGVDAGGRPYLALELVDGVPIDEYCEARHLDIDSRVSLMLQTARAVAYAHSRSIVHRDLKPANILVDANGQVHLLDFGIGKLLEAGTGETSGDTQFAGRLFTPDYASPEQLRGEAVSAACDVFSLGVVMYRVLSGRLPFAARSAHAAENDPGTDPRAPSSAATSTATRQALRGDLDTIVLKALKHLPAQRFASMSALADDLERYLRGEPVRARPDGAWYRLGKLARRNRRTVAAVAVTLVLALAAGMALYLRQSTMHDAATAAAVDESADAMARRSVPHDAPRDVAAYHDYLRARSLMLRPTEDNLHEILRLAQNATSLDPAFAHAHALLAGANLLFMDLGYENPGALGRGDASARRALSLNPKLPGAHATLGTVAAHRGQWLEAADRFKRAYDLDDQTGRIHARHAQSVLMSVGRIDEAVREYRAEFRLTPAHARGAMQVAQGLATQSRHDAEAMRFVEIALSLGWPAEETDVRELYARVARRAGRHADAMRHLALALPEPIRALDAATLTPLLQAALHTPARRAAALRALDEIDGRLRSSGTQSFASLMFLMNWYAMFDDLDRAYSAADGWVALFKSSGLSGIPHNAGFWLDEMRAFRADPRFHDLAGQLGIIEHWRRFGAADGCRLGVRISCSGAAAGG
jgi:tetratricopeptide (TPR) repeat protein